MIVVNGRPLTFAPQALGEVVPIPSATGYFYAEQGVALQDRIALYGQLYQGQPWVATLVDKVANAIARLPVHVWNQTPDGKELEELTPFARLMRRPCPEMSRYAFWRWVASTYETYGESFLLKMRRSETDRTVVGLLPMHPSRTIIKRSPENGEEVFIFALGVATAGLLEVPRSEVVAMRRWNPDNIMRGMSRLEPLRSTLFNEDATRRAIQSWWQRGARPSLMISSPESLSEGAQTRLRRQVENIHGGADRMGGTLILEEGAKPIPVQLSAEEMQYIQSRQLNREEVCAVYDVPPPVVHILDRATFSNITEQNRSMYRDTMAPRIEDYESQIENDLTPDFYPDYSREARFSLDAVLRGDFETRAKAVSELVLCGVMKPAEGRPLFDLDDAGDVADRLYANSALQPLGMPNEQVRITAGTPVYPVAPTSSEASKLDTVEGEEGRHPGTAEDYEKKPSASQRRRQRRRNQSQED